MDTLHHIEGKMKSINKNHIIGYLKGIKLSSLKYPFEVYEKLGPKAKWYYSRRYAYDSSIVCNIFPEKLGFQKNIVLLGSPTEMDSLTLNPEVSLDQDYFNNFNNNSFLNNFVVGSYVFSNYAHNTKKEYVFNVTDTIVTIGNFIARKSNNKFKLLFFKNYSYDSVNVEISKNRYYIFTCVKFKQLTNSEYTFFRDIWIYDKITNKYLNVGNVEYKNDSLDFKTSMVSIEKYIDILNDPPNTKYEPDEREKKVNIEEKVNSNNNCFYIAIIFLVIFILMIIYKNQFYIFR